MSLHRRMAAFAAATALASSLSVLVAAPAHAIEPKDAAKALGVAMADGDESKVTFEQATMDGANVVVTGLSFAQGETSQGTLRFDKTVIQAPVDGTGDVAFTSPKVDFTGGTIAGNAIGSVESAALTDLRVMRQDAITGKKIAEGAVFSSGEAHNIHFRPSSQQDEMTVDQFVVHSGDIVDNVPQQSSGKADHIIVPATWFAQANVTPKTLGYDRLDFALNWDGARDPKTQLVTLNDFTLDLKDGGTLKLTGQVGNVPVGAAAPDSPGAIASQAVIHNLKLRYEDHSLASRILKAQSEQQGVSPDQYAQQLGMALPFLLSAIGNQKFASEVSGAVSTFLKNPQSLTVTLAPNPPVSGAEIVQLVQTAPDTAPDRLNAHVTANSSQ
ncbi:hypothetical protein SAMN05216548_10292 [Faunimonas pinastri]|uniref:Uncharacterized protein n=1 Tax=Faunimonas pinastri TaxID=1855383 RepID=A0A1H9C9Z5_9HYPH|nr:hypothetical protein [Faunimonas pinastri]SEP97974.1 hypothetical protein SAMN05216548_10292 [Faunimonas pinastri]